VVQEGAGKSVSSHPPRGAVTEEAVQSAAGKSSVPSSLPRVQAVIEVQRCGKAEGKRCSEEEPPRVCCRAGPFHPGRQSGREAAVCEW